MRTLSRFARHAWAVALLTGGCASMPASTPVDGMPVAAFIDDLKAQLREVHWHVRGRLRGCGTDELREVDLRNGDVTLQLERIEQAQAGASVRLVAVPLAGIGVSPSLAADTSRRHSQQMTLKLAVAGDVPAVDFERAPVAVAPVAQAVNAAIDGFMRSGNTAPCVQLTALKLVLVVDAERQASGGFKVVVPAIGLDAAASRRDVNTLTLDWAKIDSRALR